MILVAAALSGCVEGPLTDPFSADAGSGDMRDPAKMAPTDTKRSDSGSKSGDVNHTTDTTTAHADMDDKSSHAVDPYDGPVLAQPSRGAAVALTHDETRVVVVNRDVGSISVLENVYD
ncbi:MAG TPA: hypothetical protein VFN67_02230, partial [Polyangiales bacterium]|nr:hypothetical protein [Polyangiales bacterium]